MSTPRTLFDLMEFYPNDTLNVLFRKVETATAVHRKLIESVAKDSWEQLEPEVKEQVDFELFKLMIMLGIDAAFTVAEEGAVLPENPSPLAHFVLRTERERAFIQLAQVKQLDVKMKSLTNAVSQSQHAATDRTS